LKRQGFADPEPRPPEQRDQRSQPLTMRAIPDGAHHLDDLGRLDNPSAVLPL
jgi:hypothetical protein